MLIILTKAQTICIQKIQRQLSLNLMTIAGQVWSIATQLIHRQYIYMYFKLDFYDKNNLQINKK